MQSDVSTTTPTLQPPKATVSNSEHAPFRQPRVTTTPLSRNEAPTPDPTTSPPSPRAEQTRAKTHPPMSLSPTDPPPENPSRQKDPANRATPPRYLPPPQAYKSLPLVRASNPQHFRPPTHRNAVEMAPPYSVDQSNPHTLASGATQTTKRALAAPSRARKSATISEHER